MDDIGRTFLVGLATIGLLAFAWVFGGLFLVLVLIVLAAILGLGALMMRAPR